jgi:murein DD-endopeptidase MepM/ murein hydrolase activator NlpD
MRTKQAIDNILLSLILLTLSAACTPAAASTSTVEIPPTQTKTKNSPPPTIRPTETAQPATAAPSKTPAAATKTSLPEPTPSPTACPPDLCAYSYQYILSRPIDAEYNDSVDVTYRFGSTQGKKRDPHHGVEFLNGFGTPVLAAADGVVVVAGEDRAPISEQGSWPILFYGPYSYFYGNLIVVEHELPESLQQAPLDIPQPVYTLYGHLSEISVEVGDQVKRGDKIGRVGMTGIAEGSHLHFEVRLGDNLYENSRNPELWLEPHEDEDGQLMGGIAGQLIDSYGNNTALSSVVLEHLPNGPDQPVGFTVSVNSYEEKNLIGQLPWEESFAVGDLPTGWYRITYPFQGMQQQLVEVFPGQLTLISLSPAE